MRAVTYVKPQNRGIPVYQNAVLIGGIEEDTKPGFIFLPYATAKNSCTIIDIKSIYIWEEIHFLGNLIQIISESCIHNIFTILLVFLFNHFFRINTLGLSL